MIDVAEPSKEFTAGDYARMARLALRDITSRGKLPIVVGGTGLYLRALIDGLVSGAAAVEELRDRLRASTEKRGAIYVHRILQRLDSAAAQAIHPNNSEGDSRDRGFTGRETAMTEAWKQGREPLTGYRVFRLGLNPGARSFMSESMIEQHRCSKWIGPKETRSLLAKYGDERGAPPAQVTRLSQAVQVLRGESDIATAVAAAQQGHRNYAKRQLTWFRREPEVAWFEQFGDSLFARERAQESVLRFLAG